MILPKNNEAAVILPGQTIGIIGGGQLGRMMAIAARYMGYKITVLDPTPNCPTAQVADEQIIAAYDDLDAIKKLTTKSDVITYEFENVDLAAARFIEQQGKLPQGSLALEITQNREREKKFITEVNLPVSPFAIVRNQVECERALGKIGFPAVIKTCQGGYDGKGQLKITSETDIPAAISFLENNATCIIEEWISFDKEISVVFTRTQSGELTLFPIAENEHKEHILHTTTVPARIRPVVQEKAEQATKRLAEEMGVVGTFAIEMFQQGENIFINEMAPRPHNSGHYTIEACNVSQFTQHIRAICGWPLVPIELLQPAGMMNVLGEDVPAVIRVMETCPNGYLHLYGKAEPKAKRKMGHVTFIGKTAETVQSVMQYVEKETQ